MVLKLPSSHGNTFSTTFPYNKHFTQPGVHNCMVVHCQRCGFLKTNRQCCTKEMLAILKVLEACVRLLEHSKILLHSDNQTAVAYLGYEGETKLFQWMILMTQIFTVDLSNKSVNAAYTRHIQRSDRSFRSSDKFPFIFRVTTGVICCRKCLSRSEGFWYCFYDNHQGSTYL